jgi:hypothetical protein
MLAQQACQPLTVWCLGLRCLGCLLLLLLLLLLFLLLLL